MAISSWIETGIYQKMRRDITSSPDFRGYLEESFWKQKKIHGNKPINIYHVLPAFMALGFGLISSMISFTLEFLLGLKRKRLNANGEPLPESQALGKDSEVAPSHHLSLVRVEEDSTDLIISKRLK